MEQQSARAAGILARAAKSGQDFADRYKAQGGDEAEAGTFAAACELGCLRADVRILCAEIARQAKQLQAMQEADDEPADEPDDCGNPHCSLSELAQERNAA